MESYTRECVFGQGKVNEKQHFMESYTRECVFGQGKVNEKQPLYGELHA